MSESIWWPDEAWWERKALPLGFVTLSFCQLATLVVAFLTAFLVSLPFAFPIAGVSFGGRAAVFCGVFGVGYVVSNRRVKLLPVELQALYFLRTDGVKRLRGSLRGLFGRKKLESDSPPEARRPTVAQGITVEDFKNPVPFVISDRVDRVEGETRALLLVDDKLRVEDSVSPEKPRYRLVYLPVSEDVGTRRLEVKLEGSSESLLSIDLLLKGRIPEISESITKVR
ncbi:MAG TPA: hypothetical protein VLY65_02260 [Nitrososphaerales archaeon]|nr:hypothetical protein [Nitrososphaerales archaeon]